MTVRGHLNDVTASGEIDPQNPTASSAEVTTKRAHRTGGEDEYTMSGDLTIKDTTGPVTLEATRYGEINDARGGPSRGIRCRRRDQLQRLRLVDGRWVVGDEVKLALELELVEQQQAVGAGARS